MLRRPLTIAVAAAALVTVTVPAWAAWQANGTGTSTSTATSLQAPSSLSVTPTAGSTSSSLTISWSAPAGGPAPTSYRVDRVSPDAATAVCTPQLSGSVWSCNDTNRPHSTAHTYSVVALLHSWETGQTAEASTAAGGDTTAPTVTAVELINGGGSNGVGKLAAGDAARLTFSEAMEPSSICSSFVDTGAAAASPQTANSGNDLTITVSSSDVMTISSAGNCASLTFGSISLGANYNTHGSNSITYRGNGSGANTPSSLTYDPSDNTVTITLGKRDSGNSENTSAVNAATATWTKATTGTVGTDLAGNAVSTTSRETTNQRL